MQPFGAASPGGNTIKQLITVHEPLTTIGSESPIFVDIIGALLDYSCRSLALDCRANIKMISYIKLNFHSFTASHEYESAPIIIFNHANGLHVHVIPRCNQKLP